MEVDRIRNVLNVSFVALAINLKIHFKNLRNFISEMWNVYNSFFLAVLWFSNVIKISVDFNERRSNSTMSLSTDSMEWKLQFWNLATHSSITLKVFNGYLTPRRIK